MKWATDRIIAMTQTSEDGKGPLGVLKSGAAKVARRPVLFPAAPLGGTVPVDPVCCKGGRQERQPFPEEASVPAHLSFALSRARAAAEKLL